jgi:hypothetical protein
MKSQNLLGLPNEVTSLILALVIKGRRDAPKLKIFF